MKKMRNILLVDDNDATNYFNKTIINKIGYAENVLVAKNGREALDIIDSGIIPELIFLDINMPIMSGWEFLEEYQKLDVIYKESIIILMIGGQLESQDQKRIDIIPEIKDCRGKILTKEIVREIYDTYFQKNNNDGSVAHIF